MDFLWDHYAYRESDNKIEDEIEKDEVRKLLSIVEYQLSRDVSMGSKKKGWKNTQFEEEWHQIDPDMKGKIPRQLVVPLATNLFNYDFENIDPYMQILRSKSNDFLSNNNFVMRSYIVLLANIFVTLVPTVHDLAFQYSKPDGSRYFMITRGYSNLVLYVIFSMFICQGTKQSQLFSKPKRIFMALFAFFDLCMFIYQLVATSCI